MEPASIPRTPGQTKRQQRAIRILNAAEDLLLKHGYRRITIDDIARQTGIGKGTIYLHWKSKEALFGTLFLREAVAIWRDLLQGIRADPGGVAFSRVLGTMMVVGMRRPLARAFFTWDRELLGNLVESGAGPRLPAEQFIGEDSFLTLLRRHGLIRADQDPEMQKYALQATITGFLMIEPAQVQADGLSLEQRGEALRQTIQAAFEPSQLPTEDDLREIAVMLDVWMEQLITAFEARIQESMK